MVDCSEVDCFHDHLARMNSQGEIDENCSGNTQTKTDWLSVKVPKMGRWHRTWLF